MKKKIVSIVMSLALFTALFVQSVSASDDIKGEYKRILNQYISEWGGEYTSYTLFDIDNNGSKELIVDFGGSDGSRAYGYKNGIVENYDYCAGNVKCYYQKNNNLYALCFALQQVETNHVTYEMWIDKIVLNNNRISHQTIYRNPSYRKSMNELDQSTEKSIPEVAEFLNGAKEIDFLNIRDHSLLEELVQIKVILNGTEISFDQPPILDPAGRVLVPIRKIAEAMGDDVKWNQDLQTAFVEHKEKALIIPLYTDHLYMAYSDKPVEWRKYDLDVPSQVQNGRTLTPVRAFCESLGATVNWDDSTQTVYIEYNGNYNYDSLSDETINGINMAYSIMREHNNISFEKYSEEIYAYLENSNSAVDNIAMSWGSGLFDGIVQLLSGEDATETAVKASLAQVISLLDDINRSDDNAEIINGIKFTKSGAEAIKAFSELPEENLRINNIDDLNKLSETVPELESLSKAIKATGIAVDVLAFSAEQSSYLLADYAQNIAYLDNIEKYFRATSAGNDLLYKVIDDMREEYSSKWIHSLKSLRNEGIDKVLSALVDKATFGVFGIVNFAKDLTNELTGLSTSAKGLKEFYASCILNVAFDEAYYDMMEDVSGIHFHSDEMIDMFNMQRAVKATTYMSMNKIANSVDEVSWDDRIDELEDASYVLWE